MEIHDWTHKKFNEIPGDDNPAYGANECFMICRTPDYSPLKRRFIVLKIDPVENPKEYETVTRIAEFWDSSLALEFTEGYAKLKNYDPIIQF